MLRTIRNDMSTSNRHCREGQHTVPFVSLRNTNVPKRIRQSARIVVEKYNGVGFDANWQKMLLQERGDLSVCFL